MRHARGTAFVPLLVAAFRSDVRHYQIAALSALLIYNLGWLDFGAQPLNSALAIAAALATQALCTYLFSLPSLDPRSPLITGLSLSLLLRADEPWLHALAAAIAVGSKFVVRIDGKHIFNPAGFAIVVLLASVHGVCSLRRKDGNKPSGQGRCQGRGGAEGALSCVARVERSEMRERPRGKEESRVSLRSTRATAATVDFAQGSIHRHASVVWA